MKTTQEEKLHKAFKKILKLSSDKMGFPKKLTQKQLQEATDALHYYEYFKFNV